MQNKNTQNPNTKKTASKQPEIKVTAASFLREEPYLHVKTFTEMLLITLTESDTPPSREQLDCMAMQFHHLTETLEQKD